MHLLGLASESSTNVRNGHALPLGAEAQRALPRRARQGPRVIGLQPRIRLDAMVAAFPQDGGEENVGDRERLAGDPFAAVEPGLQPGEPAAGFLDQRRPRAPSPPMPPSIIWISNSGRSTVASAAKHHCTTRVRSAKSAGISLPAFSAM